jgi:DNA polymerase III alpha subunit
VLGFYFSGHPLGEARELVEGCSSATIKGLCEIPDGFIVVQGVYITSVMTTFTKAKNEKMAILTVEDFTGSTKAVVFPRCYARFKDLLAPDRIVFLRGKVKVDEMGGGGGRKQEDGESAGPQMTLMPDEILTPEQAAELFVSDVALTLNDVDTATGKAAGGQIARARIESVNNLVQSFRGEVQVYLHLELEDEKGQPALVTVRAGPGWHLRPAPELFQGLRAILPRGAVRITAEGTRPQKPVQPAWKQRQQAPAPAAGQ